MPATPAAPVPVWEAALRPEGNNRDGINKGGMIVLLKHNGTGSMGAREAEIGGVAFERANSLHPSVSYDNQLDIEWGKAKKSVELLNELFAGAGKLQ